MYFGIFNRMILAELVKVFLMSLLALTGMFLLAGLIQEAAQKGLSPGQILMLIPLIIPNTLPFTIPATTLFATCVVYSRMSADNEVLVLRAVGVNIYHLLWPAVILGLGTTAVNAALYYDPIPRSQQMVRHQLLKDGEEIIYGMIKREGGLRQNNLDFVLFVREVQGRDLIDVVVKKRRKGPGGGYELVARSQTATVRIRKVSDTPSELSAADQNKDRATDNAMERFHRWRTGLGTGGEQYELVVRMTHCFVDSLKGETTAEIQIQEYATPLPATIFGKEPKERPSSLTWRQLLQFRKELVLLGQEMEARVADLESRPDEITAGRPNHELAREYRAGPLKIQQHLLRQYNAEMQIRPALAVGCLCFVLIGCPVGIWASRSDYLSVFMICFLPTVFVYYPVLLASLNLAKDGKVPVTAAWIANGVVALGAMVLVQRLMKR